MKKIFCFSLLSAICIFLLSGCASKNTAPIVRVVTGVEITCQHKDVQIRRAYTDMQKMEYVLLYLRLLEPIGRPKTDPGAVSGDVYEITLQLSDGSKKVYKQKDHRYLAAGKAPWQEIAPEQAEGLYRLMRKIPDDTVQQQDF
ncbi:MAG: hypothetical protein IKU07_04345 [Oscillospiraceae bacterium]|nr:hypothetical protein [Oscillospiraceae bacterium]